MKSTIDGLFNVDSSMLPYALIVCTIFTTISWVRDLAKFSFTFLVGTILIIITVIYVLAQAGSLISDQGGAGPDVNFINNNDYLNTLGFSFYAYEGIGIVMPVMATCAEPEHFKRMLTYAFITLMIIFVLFGIVGYVAWGSTMNEPLIT